MFHYPQYRSTDLALIRSFVRQFPLALITSLHDGQWRTSHIPLFFDEQEDTLAVVLPAEEFVARAKRGDIDDMKTALAAWWLADYRRTASTATP